MFRVSCSLYWNKRTFLIFLTKNYFKSPQFSLIQLSFSAILINLLELFQMFNCIQGQQDHDWKKEQTSHFTHHFFKNIFGFNKLQLFRYILIVAFHNL
jgi:hypothetical protein